jgi:hypothetical protein
MLFISEKLNQEKDLQGIEYEDKYKHINEQKLRKVLH